MRKNLGSSMLLVLELGCAEGAETLAGAPPEIGGAPPEIGGAPEATTSTTQFTTTGLGGRSQTTEQRQSFGGTQATLNTKSSGGERYRTDLLSLLGSGGQQATATGSQSSGGTQVAGSRSTKTISTGGATAATASAGKTALNGECCPDGDCLCHGPDPSNAAILNGPFKTADYAGTTGTIYYPTDAAPPLAGLALCGGFTNTGPEMAEWGPFYASWGLVTIITTTGPLDLPDLRASAMLASIQELETENTKSGGPLLGKMSDRYGISGYSMGGGGTTIAATSDPSLRTGIGLAPWGPVTGMTVPMLFLCGDADTVAGVSAPKTAANVPSMQVVISGYTHFDWFGPTEISGHYALSWQKVFLEGDTRWAPLLSEKLLGVANMQSTLH
jgi:hypothetical protein